MMTTPSIDMSLVSETPAVGLAPVLTGTGTVQMDFMPQPSSEAVARFQAAMAEPLSENDQKCPVFAKTVPEISLPPSVARISVLDAGEVVREVIAGDQSTETAVVVMGERGQDAGLRGGVMRESVVPNESVVVATRTVTTDVTQSVAEPPRTETVVATAEAVRSDTAVVTAASTGVRAVGAAAEAVRSDAAVVTAASTGVRAVDAAAEVVRSDAAVVTAASTGVRAVGATVEVVRTDASVATAESTGMSAKIVTGESVADQPDAERLVAAGGGPMVAGEQKTPEVIQVKDVESVAPIAALSPRDRVVRMDVLVEAVTAVADTLLVSPGLIRGEGEILVQLKPDVIEGSQIRISVQGKTLDVAFLTPTEQLTQMLTTRLPELQQHLVAALPAFSFKVSVGVKAGWTRETERKGSV